MWLGENRDDKGAFNYFCCFIPPIQCCSSSFNKFIKSSLNGNPVFIVRGSNNVMSKICFMASSMLSVLPCSIISLCFDVLCVCPSPWQEHCCKPVPLRKCLVKFQVMCKQSKQFQELLCGVCCPQLTLLLLVFCFFSSEEIWQYTPINNSSHWRDSLERWKSLRELKLDHSASRTHTTYT